MLFHPPGGRRFPSQLMASTTPAAYLSQFFSHVASACASAAKRGHTCATVLSHPPRCANTFSSTSSGSSVRDLSSLACFSSALASRAKSGLLPIWLHIVRLAARRGALHTCTCAVVDVCDPSHTTSGPNAVSFLHLRSPSGSCRLLVPSRSSSRSPGGLLSSALGVLFRRDTRARPEPCCDFCAVVARRPGLDRRAFSGVRPPAGTPRFGRTRPFGFAVGCDQCWVRKESRPDLPGRVRPVLIHDFVPDRKGAFSGDGRDRGRRTPVRRIRGVLDRNFRIGAWKGSPAGRKNVVQGARAARPSTRQRKAARFRRERAWGGWGGTWQYGTSLWILRMDDRFIRGTKFERERNADGSRRHVRTAAWLEPSDEARR